MNEFLKAVRERVVVYDGAMGTSIQVRQPSPDDFWGNEGCNELLVLSRPDIVKDIHASFFAVGCDVVETNTFGATSIVLGEYGLETRVGEINLAAVKLAREVAQGFSTPARPRFVAGSIGPSTKLPSLEPYDIDVVGLNCATGPREMNDAVRYLCHNSTKHVSVLPNAGLPQNEGGRAVYKLQPQELAEYHRRFISEYGVRIVGGCCGTTPEHLSAVVRAVENLEPAVRDVKPVAAASSAYSYVPLDLDPKPLIVAEEMNTTTRVEHFRNLVRGGKYDDILALAKKLVNEGSHMLDLCCAIVGEDEKGYMTGVLQKVATRVPAPVLVDSTEADVIEEGLKRIPGKAIINSINLEDGEKRTSKVLPMAKRYGAAVIALTIDETGMALTAERKVAIAKRIFELATKKYGIRPVDLIFDPLTLPISTGQEDYRTAGMETLEAVKRIKQEIPEVRTTLVFSNISC